MSRDENPLILSNIFPTLRHKSLALSVAYIAG